MQRTFIASVALALTFATLDAGLAAPRLLAQSPMPDSVSHATTLVTSTGTLHGTLLLPANASGRTPVVLLIAGSGPTDRDGNTLMAGMGKNNSLRLLAEALARRGVASVRYDKRGIAASSGAARSERDLRFHHYVDDAAGWIRQLRADPRFSSVVVVGHSEGALIGTIAARAAAPDGLVLLAGPGRPLADVLRQQLAGKLPPPLDAQSDSILTDLLAGRTRDSVPAPLMVLYRPSVQPYLISQLGIDPAAELGRLSLPVLVVQGTTDVQVTEEDARRLAAARPGTQLLIVDGMNHVLKEVPAELARQQASYGDPTLPVVPRLVTVIAEFIGAMR